MLSKIRIVWTAIVFALLFSLNATIVRAQQNALTADQTKIVDTVNTVFAAARADDIAKFDSVVAPDFYIFDGGLRFNGDAIMTFIKTQHEAGKHYEWNVTEPDVHISGHTAWIAYTNKGSVSDSSGIKNLTWLESAFLEKRAGVWKIVFMQSTRAPEAAQENHGVTSQH
ncbi:MAG TPA: nuclear transport factor 2 family protein [Granulicella sp.]